MRILIITEANEIVASGHLMESIALYRELIKKGVEVCILVNSDIPEFFGELLRDYNYSQYCKTLDDGKEDIIRHLINNKYDVIVTDLREIKNCQLKYIKKRLTGKTICLDEWGNRFLECDVIVNNMADKRFWNYKDSTSKIYTGPEFLILSEKLECYHKKEKIINEKIKKIVISMGGVDKNNNTKRIVDVLKDTTKYESVDVVLGGGYKWDEEITAVVENISNYRIHKNIDYLFDLFYEADLVFSAGGNTMYELAAIGTPTIIIPTMEHEKINGKAFEKKGFSHVVKLEEVTNIIANMSKEHRNKESLAGKDLVDGYGLKRISNIIMEMNNDGR